jgi:hypothetical protein
MSIYEEERGTLILPSAAVPTFRKSIVSAMNVERARVLEAAEKLYEYINAPDPAKEGERAKRSRLKPIREALKSGKPTHTIRYAISDVFSKAFDALDGQIKDSFYGYSSHRYSHEVRQEAINLLCPYSSKEVELRAPKKKDYPPLPMSTTQFDCDDASLTIDAKTREVHWYVGRNNHAVDHAWASPLGKAFEKALTQVAWTRGTGGSFNYSNEYDEEAAMDHGGAAVSISRAFGPEGKKNQEDQYGFKIKKSSPGRR